MRHPTPEMVRVARELVSDAESARNADWRQMLVALARDKLRRAQDHSFVDKESGRFGSHVRLLIQATVARAEALSVAKRAARAATQTAKTTDED